MFENKITKTLADSITYQHPLNVSTSTNNINTVDTTKSQHDIIINSIIVIIVDCEKLNRKIVL